jgi:hypothetical protein
MVREQDGVPSPSVVNEVAKCWGETGNPSLYHGGRSQELQIAKLQESKV